APEQVDLADVDGRTDLYSLGVLLYCILADQAPFTATDPYAISAQIQGGEFPPLSQVAPGVPEELSAIVARAMALDSRDRYADASSLYEELIQFLYASGRRVGARDLANHIESLGGQSGELATPLSSDTFDINHESIAPGAGAERRAVTAPVRLPQGR